METAEVYVMTHDEMKVKRVYGHGESNSIASEVSVSYVFTCLFIAAHSTLGECQNNVIVPD